MNIFVLDKCPYQAASYMCDKHVVKMVLETGQMLSTVHRAHGNTSDLLYRPTHEHHPCTIWAGETTANYTWLLDHFIALNDEYRKRYGRTHLTFAKLYSIVRHVPADIPRGELTPFAQAMPDEYKGDDAVNAYRRYYEHKTEVMPVVYAHSQSPWWLNLQTC